MESTNEPIAPKKVPTFIKVLTVFSFVGVGTGALYYFLQTRAARHNIELEAAMGGLRETIRETQGLSEYYARMYQWQQGINLAAFVSQFISLIGIIYIRKLKKGGFVLYTVSECISLGLLIAYGVKFGFKFEPDFLFDSSGSSGFVLIGTIIFDFAFIIMYNANYKHLK